MASTAWPATTNASPGVDAMQTANEIKARARGKIRTRRGNGDPRMCLQRQVDLDCLPTLPFLLRQCLSTPPQRSIPLLRARGGPRSALATHRPQQPFTTRKRHSPSIQTSACQPSLFNTFWTEFLAGFLPARRTLLTHLAVYLRPTGSVKPPRPHDRLPQWIIIHSRNFKWLIIPKPCHYQQPMMATIMTSLGGTSPTMMAFDPSATSSVNLLNKECMVWERAVVVEPSSEYLG